MDIGFALCGSFCTYDRVFAAMEAIAQTHTLIPIFSKSAYTIDSRFGTHESHIEKAEAICECDVLERDEKFLCGAEFTVPAGKLATIRVKAN